jgi:hypothetical protein
MWDFIARHLWVALALLFSFGGVGVLFALFAFGIPAALLLARAAGLLQSLVDFLKTPIGQAVAVIAIAIAAFVAGDVHRLRLDAEREKAAAVAQIQRENALRASIADEAAAKVADIQKQSAALQQQVAIYERTLSAQNVTACRATGADVRQLRKLQ